jgi:cytochrome b
MTSADAGSRADTRQIPVWDLPVRLFHWSLAVLVTLSVATGLTGGNAMRWHALSGEAIIVLVAFRILWGFVGSRHARFGDFLYGPKAVLEFVRRLLRHEYPRYLGHNPLGGWMVLVLLLVLLAQASAGLFANDDIAFEGPLYPLISKGLSDTLTSWHKLSGRYLIIALVVMHIAAVVYHRLAMGERLARAMITGRKEWPATLSAPPSQFSSSWLALGLFAALCAGLYLLVLKPS